MSLIAGHARSRHAWTQILVAIAVVFLCISSAVTGLDKETCYSRQHRDVIVDVRVALTKEGTTMESRVTPSEKDCILSCCSQEVRPGTVMPVVSMTTVSLCVCVCLFGYACLCVHVRIANISVMAKLHLKFRLLETKLKVFAPKMLLDLEE